MRIDRDRIRLALHTAGGTMGNRRVQGTPARLLADPEPAILVGERLPDGELIAGPEDEPPNRDARAREAFDPVRYDSPGECDPGPDMDVAT